MLEKILILLPSSAPDANCPSLSPMRTLRAKKRPHIAILYHCIKTNGEEAEKYFTKQNEIIDEDTERIIDFVAKTLKKRKYRVDVVKLESKDLAAIAAIKADFIFNLVDSKAMELKVARVLERMHIPYSGSCFNALLGSDNKVKTKAIFDKAKIPTPEFSIVGPKDKLIRSLLPSKFPVILKPAFEHGSVGITVNSVVTTFKHFKSRVKHIRRNFKQSMLCEQFIKGEELQVTVIEKDGYTEALPIAEMTVDNVKNNKWNIYGFKEKWHKKSAIYKNLHFVAPPRSLPLPIAREIQRQAIKAFYAFGFRDYARFDIRYNPKKKEWYFLEGNGNPGISSAEDDAMTAALMASGMSMEDFILTIVNNGLRMY
jgi:D-alanine-D-alanine ligase